MQSEMAAFFVFLHIYIEKEQFKVRHICYYSWTLTQEDVDAISASLSNCVTNGEDYKEPLQGNPDKVVEWEDTSNLPPKKVEGNTLQQSRDNNQQNIKENTNMNKKQTIRLTESDLHRIVKESVNRILVKEMGTNQEEYEHYEKQREKLVIRANRRIYELKGVVNAYRKKFGQEAIDDDEYFKDIERFVNLMLTGGY